MSQTSPDDHCFNELLRELNAGGYTDTVRRIDNLLNHTAWSSSSELLGELGLAILAFQTATPKLSPKLKEILKRCMVIIRRTWPGIR